MLKTCMDCRESKDRDDFYRAKNAPDGLQYICKACSGVRSKRRSIMNTERWLAESPYANTSPKTCTTCRLTLPRASFELARSLSDGLSIYCRDCKSTRALESGSRWVSDVVCGARQRDGDVCDLSTSYIRCLFAAQDGRCAYSGIPLVELRRPRLMSGVSLERVDSTRKHVIGNVVLVCNALNQAKNSRPLSELEEFLSMITGKEFDLKPEIERIIARAAELYAAKKVA